MDEKEYEKFMTYLYNERIRPGKTRYWTSHLEKKYDPGHYHYWMERLRSAVILLRFINRNCATTDEIYRTITLNRITRLVNEVHYGVRLNNRLMEELGFFDVFDEYYDEIVEGMKYEHMPNQEIDILRDLGSEDPGAELLALLYIVKSKRKTAERFKQEKISNRLTDIEDQLSRQLDKMEELEDTEEPPKKSKRWFKGLGQIAEGSALSLANIGLVVGIFSFPVAPETAGWGALVSSINGVGKILNGIGEFMGE